MTYAIYHDKKAKENFIKFLEPNHCFNCRRPFKLKEAIFIFRAYDLRWQFSTEDLYCRNCISRIKAIFNSTIQLATVTDKISPKWHLFTSDMTFKSTCTIGEASISNEKIESNTSEAETIDRTRYAGKESWEGSTIGTDITELLEKKDQPILDDKKASTLLEEIKTSTKILPGVEHEMIEDKRY
jgi:hypothetical protein